MISTRPSHTSAVITASREVAERLHQSPIGPANPKPGPTFPSPSPRRPRSPRTASMPVRPKGLLEHEPQCADHEEPDVKEDERHHGRRSTRSSTETPFRTHGHDDLPGARCCSSSRRRSRPMRRWRTTLIDPPVDPAEAPANMSPTSVIAVQRPPERVVRRREARGGHDRHGLEARRGGQPPRRRSGGPLTSSTRAARPAPATSSRR